MRKKIYSGIVIIGMLLCLVGCSDKPEPTGTDSENTEQAATGESVSVDNLDSELKDAYESADAQPENFIEALDGKVYLMGDYKNEIVSFTKGTIRGVDIDGDSLEIEIDESGEERDLTELTYYTDRGYLYIDIGEETCLQARGEYIALVSPESGEIQDIYAPITEDEFLKAYKGQQDAGEIWDYLIGKTDEIKLEFRQSLNLSDVTETSNDTIN